MKEQIREDSHSVSIVKLYRRESFEKATELAAERKGKLPSLNEFIRNLREPERREKFNRDWYWLRDDDGILVSGCARVDLEKGTIAMVSNKEYANLAMEERAVVESGPGPMAIAVTPLGLFITARYPSGDLGRVAIAFDGKMRTAAELRE